MPAKPDRGGKVNGLAGAVKHTLCSVLSAMGSLPERAPAIGATPKRSESRDSVPLLKPRSGGFGRSTWHRLDHIRSPRGDPKANSAHPSSKVREATADLARLHAEMERLREENEGLRKRLKKQKS
jgi:hypothetical protein